MPILLYRVDDRLIHGQVVIGWGRPLGIDFIVLVDDQVRLSPWEQDLYRMGVPPEIEVLFVSPAEAAERIPGWKAGERRGIILMGDIATMMQLHAAGAVLDAVNLGGIHHRPGRSERLPYLYLTDEEINSLRTLEASGTRVSAQDLPTATPVSLRSLE
jgi:PTS system mannose-specific IIB component/fructoselysine and glucoselysine-specific PTS system IIB component